jgi:ribosome recycling factor
MALGSAVFWPLNQTAENNKSEIKDLQIKVEDHTMADRQMVLQQVDAQTIEKVAKLEAWQQDQDKRAYDELQKWRDKFQGLDTK